jgi:hypothetical protein
MPKFCEKDSEESCGVGQRFHDITQGRNGDLYALTDGGRLYRSGRNRGHTLLKKATPHGLFLPTEYPSPDRINAVIECS